MIAADRYTTVTPLLFPKNEVLDQEQYNTSMFGPYPCACFKPMHLFYGKVESQTWCNGINPKFYFNWKEVYLFCLSTFWTIWTLAKVHLILFQNSVF